jgi:hypothetical protein
MPEQAAEIEFIERTPHLRLRHASFRRIRPRDMREVNRPLFGHSNAFRIFLIVHRVLFHSEQKIRSF